MSNLDETKVILFCCDIQQCFENKIPFWTTVVKVADRLISSGKIMEIPLIVTEQYPNGLGSTTEALDIQSAVHIFSKTRFTMLIPEVKEKLVDIAAKCNCISNNEMTVVVFGMETHICVMQTVLDLLSFGCKVIVVADGVTSRAVHDKLMALRRMELAGAVITTHEAFLFQLVKDAKSKHFKAIQALIKETLPDTGLTCTKL